MRLLGGRFFNLSPYLLQDVLSNLLTDLNEGFTELLFNPCDFSVSDLVDFILKSLDSLGQVVDVAFANFRLFMIRLLSLLLQYIELLL